MSETFLFLPGNMTGPSYDTAREIRCAVPAMSANDQADLQWLVEYGSRWTNEPAESRKNDCVATTIDLSARITSAVYALHQTPPDQPIDLRDAHAAIAVDQSSDLVPWELLDFGHGPAGLVAGSIARVPQNGPALPQKPPKSGPLRVLLITARPFAARDVPYLAVAQHLRNLILDYPEGVSLRIVRPPTIEAFSAALSHHEDADVVHFDGHGDLKDGAPILAFETEEGGPLFIPAENFIAPIRAVAPRLVVLNACRSAQSPGATSSQHAHHGIEPSLAYQIALEAGVAVVAMRYLVRADTAGRFVATLYKTLLAGHSIGKAVQAGRRQLFETTSGVDLAPDGSHSAVKEGAEWLLPVLYLTGPDMPILSNPATPRDQASAPTVTLHGLDQVFLGLEKATDAGVLPVLWGPLGADKMALAQAFAEWRLLTRNDEPPLASPMTLFVKPDGTTEPVGELIQDNDSHVARILRLVPAPGAPPLIGSTGLAAVLSELRQSGTRNIAIVDGAFDAFPSQGDGVLWLGTLGVNDDAMIEIIRDETEDFGADIIRRFLDAAVGNPAFVRTLASGSSPKAEPLFARAVEILESTGLRATTRAAIGQFRRVINIVTLRHMLHELGSLEQDGNAYLDPDIDAASQERRELDALRARGLLTVLSPNCYRLSPWLSAVLAKDNPDARTTYDDANALAFSRAIAEVAEEYNSDYFLRGNRDVAYVIGLEGDNIDHAWRILDHMGDYDRMLSLFSGRLALWTRGGHFDRIEREAQTLEPLLNSDQSRSKLLIMRLQAANVMGRLPELANAVETVAARYTEDWVNAGRPRGTTRDGLPALYFNMLNVKQNLAATLRVIGRTEEHRRLCLELLDEYERAQYGNGTIQVIVSLANALPPEPVQEEAAELRDLFKRHFNVIATGDRILQSEVLHKLAMLNAAAGMDVSNQTETRQALEQSEEWLQAALSLLLPPEGSNHYALHRDLAQILARLGEFEKMDSHAMSAIEGYLAIGTRDSAAFAAAYAAQGWLWAGRADRALDYRRAANEYLSQSPPSQIGQMARQILASLG